MADVDFVIYANGDAYPKEPAPAALHLPDGWAEDLVKNGKLTVETKTMDTGQTVWSNASSAKMKYQNDHNNHIDIALDAAKLEK